MGKVPCTFAQYPMSRTIYETPNSEILEKMTCKKKISSLGVYLATEIKRIGIKYLPHQERL